MLSAIGWLEFIFLLCLLSVIAIWGSWKSFTGFYNEILPSDQDKRVAWNLIHPGWWLLPLVPFIGKEWLMRVLNESLSATSLQLPFEEHGKTEDDVELVGGASVLISEYYDRGSGLAHGTRVQQVQPNSVFVSGFTEIDALTSHQIPVYTARPIVREWATLEKNGESFLLQPQRKKYIISVFEKGKSPKLCYTHPPQHIRFGDRFVIGITEFEFLQLPYLILARKNGEIICEDIEKGYSSKADGLLPEFEIFNGKLIASDYSFYKPVINFGLSDKNSIDSKHNIILQPGDRLMLNDGEELHVSYARTDDFI